jgi:2-keto-4-pentenoate hydratase/2-oxohepta-3-ene-1,7-dioic acid hydratase in catechol pathway
MRVARYSTTDARPRVGIVSDDHVVPVDELDSRACAEPIAILAAGSDLWAQMAEAAADRPGIPLEEVTLLAPISRPPKFLAVGMNSADHAQEARDAPRTPEILGMLNATQHLQEAFPEPRWPLLFNKQTNSITGPFDPIWIPIDSDRVDYEGEAVAVIGTRVRRADEQTAAAAIAGWTVTNDVSIRDWQWNTSQTWLGKSFDTHGPIGPWIVTADEFDPQTAVIRTWVNDEQRQEGRLADQLLSAAKLVSLISQVCTLEPGDLIATGTPGGIGGITGQYLVAGDRVRVEVSGIGQIDNPVAAEPVAEETAACVDARELVSQED